MTEITMEPPVLVAEVTLADGSLVYVPEGVHAIAPASAGWITVRVPCAAFPAGRNVARVVIRSSADPPGEYPWVYQPPMTVPLCGYLDVPVSGAEITSAPDQP